MPAWGLPFRCRNSVAEAVDPGRFGPGPDQIRTNHQALYRRARLVINPAMAGYNRHIVFGPTGPDQEGQRIGGCHLDQQAPHHPGQGPRSQRAERDADSCQQQPPAQPQQQAPPPQAQPQQGDGEQWSPKKLDLDLSDEFEPEVHELLNKINDHYHGQLEEAARLALP